MLWNRVIFENCRARARRWLWLMGNEARCHWKNKKKWKTERVVVAKRRQKQGSLCFFVFFNFCTLLRFSHVSLDVGVCVTKGKVIFSSLGVEKGVDGLYWKKILGTNCIHKYYSKPNILKKTKTKARYKWHGSVWHSWPLCAETHTTRLCCHFRLAWWIHFSVVKLREGEGLGLLQLL